MSQKGFTLIEAVLSIALIGIGIVGTLFLFQGAVRDSLIADQSVTAANIARETMDKIVSYRSANGYAAALTEISTNNTYDENPVTGFPGYVLDATALEVDQDDEDNTDDFLDASPGSNFSRITIQVTWNNGNNDVTLSTLIADY